MEIPLLIVLFLVGTVGAAVQALKHLERRRDRSQGDQRRAGRGRDDPA